MARSEQPRRRFAPEPIETTFRSTASGQKHRLDQPHNGRPQNQQPPPSGPNYELTPEPSPRSPSPPHDLFPRRRFAPQLIETSRRSRRVGDVGPATRPTDKTDITPYTKNIYTAPSRHRLKHNEEPTWENAPTRRESEDEHVQQYLLELAAKEAERQMQEDALAAFPNSHAREGGVDHFYFRESSESEGSPESTSPVADGSHRHQARRQSSNLGFNWWHKHMQKHAEQMSQDHVVDTEGDDDMMAVDEPVTDISQQKPAVPETEAVTKRAPGGDSIMRTDSDLDRMDLTAPPDPMWITTNTQHQVPSDDRQSRTAAKGPIGESFMPLIQSDPSTTLVREKPLEHAPAHPRPIGESRMPYVPSTPSSRPADVPYAKPSQIPPDTGFRKQASPFGRPFGGLAQKPPASKTKQVSPPMLGKDLVFRMCPSPKATKLEPEPPKVVPQVNQKPREHTGQKGLWRGYCARSESNDDFLVPADLHAPPMLATPRPPATPDGSDSSSQYGSASLSDEPSSLSGTEHRGRTGYPQRLHRPEDGLWRGKAARNELDDKIAQEFDDSFVTQVYNYLSLGYPATARAYDDELSQISLMSMNELEKDDEKQLAKGHLFEADAQTPRHLQCPRWKALRTYITEWARQHPNLDSMDGLGWGVRERRGSWAI